MPGSSDSVDLGSVYVGDDEFGGDYRVQVSDQHLFVAGASRSGKNSFAWSVLRCLAPLIRDGLVRLWVCDPKQMEFSKLAPIAHRYADTDAGDEDDYEFIDEDDPVVTEDDTDAADDAVYTCLDLVREYVMVMEAKQRLVKASGSRKATLSRETPLDLLILDELGALTAYGDNTREYKKLLALVGSQGLGTLNSMMGFVQEPTKDTVPIREFFTTKLCLRVTHSMHVDMVLGENARERGALADEIPNIAQTAGIGYAIQERTRAPRYVRLAFVTDSEIDDLIDFVRNGQSLPRVGATLKVVA